MRPLTTPETWTTRSWANGRRAVPGLLLSAFVAVSAVLAAPLLAGIVQIPAMVIALVVGIALNPVARKPSFQPGIVFCLKTLLRWAVALLGLRIASVTASIFALIKVPLIEASTWGLLIAISALGLGTSLTAIAALGWRHVATVIGTTCVIFFLVTAGLMMLR
jgi:uncharacterized membrane protein YadS